MGLWRQRMTRWRGSERRGQKRGRVEQRAEREEQKKPFSLGGPSLDLLGVMHCDGIHSEALNPASHHTLRLTTLSVGTEHAWSMSFAGVSLGLAGGSRGQRPAVFPDPRRACHSPAKTGAHLWKAAPWQGRSQQSVGSKSAHSSVSPGHISQFSCPTGFHSYFTSELQTSLIPQLTFTLSQVVLSLWSAREQLFRQSD